MEIHDETSAPHAAPMGAPMERREMSVLCCDLVGSTPLAAALDPEDFHDLVLPLLKHCADCVTATGGFVARFTGDGLLAYFGYPSPLEDAAERAVHAAWRACAELSRATVAGRSMELRAGVANGVFVVGSLLRAGESIERFVSGEAVNLAARLQSAARPGRVVVSDEVRRRGAATYAFEELGELSLEGFPQAVQAWEVLGPKDAVDRFAPRRAAGLSDWTGRAHELAMLLGACDIARKPQTRVLGVVGPPGIGKSRLLAETKARVLGQGAVRWVEVGAASLYQHTPFHLAARLAASLAGDGDVAFAVEPGPADGVGEGSSAERRREAILEGLAIRSTQAVGREPVVLALEDLHWADPSSLEFVDRLIASQLSLLVVYTSRTEIHWRASDRNTIVRLQPLGLDESERLARAAAGPGFPAAEARRVAAESGGVPLFIEELSRRAARRDAGPPRQAPPTLAGLLATQLEELGPHRRGAQIAAVLGHRFQEDLFEAMLEAESLVGAGVLAGLLNSQVVAPAGGNGVYSFRHALIASAAYDALTRKSRSELHLRAAKLIEARWPQIALMEPEVVGRHWALGGEAERAVACWETAAARAVDRHALGEAEHAYRQALEALAQLRRTPARDADELRLRSGFNRVMQVSHAYTSPEITRSQERVAELAAQLGDLDGRAREARARWLSVFTAARYAEAEQIAEQVMDLTQRHGDAPWRRAFRLRATIQHGFYTGELAASEHAFLQWRDLRDGSHRGAGDDVLSMGIAAIVAGVCGRRGEAWRRMSAARQIGVRSGHPYDLAMAHHLQAALHYHQHEFAGCAEAGARLAAAATDNDLEYAGLLAQVWLSAADAEAGRGEAAVARVRDALAGFDRLGAHVARSLWLSVAARAEEAAGAPEAAVETLLEALRANPQEKVHEPEIRLQLAGLARRLGRLDMAEREVACALAVAAGMGAASYRLRALVELTRLTPAGSADRTARLAEAWSTVDEDACPADVRDLRELRA